MTLELLHAMGLGGPEEDHKLHHCCWTGRVGEREEEEERACHKRLYYNIYIWFVSVCCLRPDYIVCDVTR